MLAITAVVAGASRRAEACSPPEELSLYPYLADASDTIVPTDGVIAFRASATGELEDVQAMLSMTVTQGEVEVEGAIETIILDTRTDWVISHDLIIVWRPSEAFAAGGEYTASVAVASAYSPDEIDPTLYAIDVVVGDGPAGAFPAPMLSGAALDKAEVESGDRVCCDEGNDAGCGFAACRAPTVADLPMLAVTVDAGTDPMLTQGYVRLRAGTDGETAPYSVLGLGRDIGPADLIYPFAEAADTYCIAAEIVSLIDGTVGEPVTLCVDHGDLELASRPNPELEDFLEACIDEPYWEDTDEPYVPGSEEGGSDESGGDESGGDESGGGDGGLDEDARGCSCNADGSGSLVPGLLALVIGAGARRRRRA